MIYNNILETIGSTPIIKLNSIGSELDCNLYVKLEMFNPGGSVKDRTAFCMIDCAEKSGRIKPGDTLIEPTSGNTGIGLALAAAVRGYKLIICMPKKMSMEKEITIKALGAKVVRTRTEAAYEEEDSNFSIAKKLNKEIPDSHILDQWENICNPEVHYNDTSQEILDDFGTDLDMVVMGVGTGGTISGIGKRLKEQIPNIKIVGADPYGSILGGEDEYKGSPYHVEGIGYDFIPKVFDQSIVDEFVKVNDKEAFATAKALIKEEGLLIGGSCGSATFAALKAAKSLKKGQNCLIILPDSIRNYMRKFLSDDWMKENDII
ncbi:MAG: pyridoxal-phosphate dependent enzyme [Candidatus Marinimicrobia bacterium]|nr:pyridoxal-phosphate dependent enzyme [Candidatus Neomarinimicrobiota bacterium]